MYPHTRCRMLLMTYASQNGVINWMGFKTQGDPQKDFYQRKKQKSTKIKQKKHADIQVAAERPNRLRVFYLQKYNSSREYKVTPQQPSQLLLAMDGLRGWGNKNNSRDKKKLQKKGAHKAFVHLIQLSRWLVHLNGARIPEAVQKNKTRS